MTTTSTKPNILWICTDQQRYDTIRAMGNQHIHTPNLDKLCTEGTAFSRAYCQNPICAPSRAGFLTGLYPSSIHVLKNGQTDFPSDVKIFPKRLSEHGYRCGLVGKLHLLAGDGIKKRIDDGFEVFQYSQHPYPNDEGGDYYSRWLEEQGVSFDDIFEKNNVGKYYRYKSDIPVKYHQSAWGVDKSIEFILNTGDPRPWFLNLSLFDPHRPFDAPLTYEQRYDPGQLPRPLFGDNDLQTQEKLKSAFHQTRAPKTPDAEYMQIKANYYGMIELIDEQLGRLFDALDRTGQRENTIIVFMSDHGEMLGDHGLIMKGCRFYEGAVHVPLIFSWKGACREGIVSNELVELTDIVPTLAEAAGIPLELTHGKSVMPILEGTAAEGRHREFVRCEYYDALDENRTRTVSDRGKPTTFASMYFDGRYKLVVYHHLQDIGELYDLHNDPHEFRNLWDEDGYDSLKVKLLKKSFDSSMVIMDQGSPTPNNY